MSLATCSRRRVSALRALSRNHSSTTNEQVAKSSPSTRVKANVQSHTTLPPAKLRALIALYHQADSWITPENLEQRIDEAFVPDPLAKQPKGLMEFYSPNDRATQTTRVSVEELNRLKSYFRMAPKMAQWNQATAADYAGTDWDTNTSRRELRVVEALYGVNAPMGENPRPGLELLQEVTKKPTKGSSGGQKKAS